MAYTRPSHHDTDANDDGEARRPPRRRSSVASVTSVSSTGQDSAVLSVEMLEGDRTASRRRGSSSISFEKHDSFIMEELLAHIDDDELDLNLELDGNPNEAADRNGVVRSQRQPSRPVRRGSRPGNASSRNNDAGCILSRIEGEIIEKEIRAGKLVVDDDEEMEGGPQQGGGTTGRPNRRASFASSSGGSSTSRRVSFNNGARRNSAASYVESAHSSRSSLLSRGRSVRAGSNLREDLLVALRDLGDSDDEEDDDAAIARAVMATMGGQASDPALNQRGSLTIQVETAVPPPRGTRPRRSSMKRPEERRDWSRAGARNGCAGAGA